MMKLKELRKKSGLTQQQVADALGLERSAYVKYETGTRVPPLDNLSKLADLFGVTIDELAGRDRQPLEDDAEIWELRERFRADPDMRLLFSTAANATPEHIKAAAAMLKALEDDE